MKKEKEYCHAFNVGDIISSQKNERRVILEVCSLTENLKVPVYKFMHLTDLSVKMLTSDNLQVRKGDLSEQLIDIVDKYFYLYQFDIST